MDEGSSMIQKIQLVSSDFVIFSPFQEWLDIFRECFINTSSADEKCYLFTKFAEQNIDNCITELSGGHCSSETRQIWENAVNCPGVKCENLRDLALLSYVVAIPLVKQQNSIGNHSASNLWLCDVSYEMPIAFKYKDISKYLWPFGMSTLVAIDLFARSSKKFSLLSSFQ